MKKLSESIWADLQDRSSGEVTRKEDMIIPVDMGGSVLWSDRDFMVGDEYLFTFDEAVDLTKNSEWRLPTLEEVAELDRLKDVFYVDDDEFYFELDGKHLGFPKTGLKRQVYSSHSPAGFREFMVDEGRFYYGWTSTPYDNGSSHIFTFDAENIWHSPVNNKRVTDQIIQPNIDKLCIRLVKDK